MMSNHLKNSKLINCFFLRMSVIKFHFGDPADRQKITSETLNLSREDGSFKLPNGCILIDVFNQIGEIDPKSFNVRSFDVNN